jgi:hypothetical protein
MSNFDPGILLSTILLFLSNYGPVSVSSQVLLALSWLFPHIVTQTHNDIEDEREGMGTSQGSSTKSCTS